LVDIDDYEAQKKYYWRAICKKGNWYAYRREIQNGKTHTFALHRVIAKSKPGEEPHHENHNTFDNRKINLKNVPHNKHPIL
jgi:predicted DNA-binding transcriptional regulator YafY